MRVARTVRDHDLVQLIRNQQVAGSTPAGGSMVHCKMSRIHTRGGFARRFSRRDIEKAMEVVRALKNTLSRA